MAQQDLISVNIPEADLMDIKSAVNTLQAKLLPHLKTLSTQERIELPKMGDKTVAFVRKAYEYGRQNKDLVPSFLDRGYLWHDWERVGESHQYQYVWPKR